MEDTIPFNKPFIAGKELFYVAEAITLGNIGTDGYFCRKSERLLREILGTQKILMTQSCTAALEIAAMLCDLKKGDEVIMPSYTFVSTANAVVRLGAKPVFVDIRSDTLNMDESKVEEAITRKTKAVFPVHYAGVACEMTAICEIAKNYNLLIVEDAAQALGALYKNKPLGGFGDLAAFSFHETKNISCGVGGALCINREDLNERAQTLRDKGTDRSRFLEGKVDKYTWVDSGSSYAPSDLNCAYLYGQLECFNEIAQRRKKITQSYREHLKPLEVEGILRLPQTSPHCTSSNHMFYILLTDEKTRDSLSSYLIENGIYAVFHYVPLHTSPMGKKIGAYQRLPITDDISSRILRLPFFNELGEDDIARVAFHIGKYFSRR